MKILFVTNQVPFPPDNGTRIVSYHAMRLMHEAGNELCLAVLSDEDLDVEKRFRTVAKFCKNDMAFKEELPSRHPLRIQIAAIFKDQLFFIQRFKSTAFLHKLRRLIDEFRPEVIHFDQIPMFQYSSITPSGVGAVASPNDSYALTLENAFSIGTYHGFEYAYKKWQYRRAREYERLIYATFNQVHVMSEVDKHYLQRLNPNAKVSVIPNGVESSLFDVANDTRDKTDIIFVSHLVGQNLICLKNFLRHGWLIVNNRYPNAKFKIVGKVGREAQDLKKQYDLQHGVNFAGYMEDLGEAYRTCGIAIVPINKDCGIVNKVIEAMAAGLVVVGFKKTFSGIPQAKSGVHFVEASDYEDMGHSIINLLDNTVSCGELKTAAHQLAKKYYTWSTRKDAYHQMYKTAQEDARTHSSRNRDLKV